MFGFVNHNCKKKTKYIIINIGDSMRTIEYKKFISNNNVTYKGSKTSVIDIYKHAQKYLTEMDMNDSFNKKIAHMYLVNLSKKGKLNRKEKEIKRGRNDTVML